MFQTMNRVYHRTQKEAVTELVKKNFVLVDKKQNHWMGGKGFVLRSINMLWKY